MDRYNHGKIVGKRVVLEALTPSHIEELPGLFDVDIWQWYSQAIDSVEDLKAYFRSHLHNQGLKKSYTFMVRVKDGNELIGSTTYLDYTPQHQRLEIGSTWYVKKWQRTFVNTETKLLLLTKAFEELKCNCVQIKTDDLNVKSKKAIERLGAKFDGLLRGHIVCDDGRVRHTAYYSILSNEWPALKESLIEKLSR